MKKDNINLAPNQVFKYRFYVITSGNKYTYGTLKTAKAGAATISFSGLPSREWIGTDNAVIARNLTVNGAYMSTIYHP